MKKVILLAGPTGVGKTSASLLLARSLHTEIIGSDSMQIYRRMDIGTAKPTPEERRAVRHHMIDVVEPWEYYSTGEYIRKVQGIISTLHGKGKIPLIVGGTGLYIKAMTRGIFPGPPTDREMRNSLLEEEKQAEGSLYERLKALDPGAAVRIEPADIRRIIRALEVCLKSERPMTELHEELTKPLPYDFIKIGITRDRKELYGIIDKRVDAMMEQCLLDEVRKVVSLICARGPLQELKDYPSLQAIGYKEIARHLSGELGLDEAVALVKQQSRNYAKRQFTWFRKEEGIRWIDITGLSDPSEIHKKIEAVLSALL
ncbi:MAG: tRNA (adenosine(37)-N6)-dimethylallyltransferase MiaA [Nitrospirales bacterium]|nr:tRNA (adenosine(37)-N6)-dimethylallyltransferase MiaA [Nitrospirales bacterium]